MIFAFSLLSLFIFAVSAGYYNTQPQPQDYNNRNTGGYNYGSQYGSQYGQNQDIVPVYLHSDGTNRALLLTPQAQSLDPTVYARFWNAGRVWCIAQSPSAATPSPLYAYRLDKGSGNYNHFYTTNSQEIGVTQEGQTGNYGYRCLGILGYVGSQSTVAGRSDMVPVYRWYSGQTNTHLFDIDAGLGSRLNQGFTSEGTMGYVFRC